MRLDYFITNSANQSRKEARRTIMAGRDTTGWPSPIR